MYFSSRVSKIIAVLGFSVPLQQVISDDESGTTNTKNMGELQVFLNLQNY